MLPKPSQARLEKCRRLRKIFKVCGIEDVPWTDEKNFAIEVAYNSQNESRLISPSQRHSSDCERRVVTKSLFARRVMVWEGVTAKAKTPLVFIEENFEIDAKFYQDKTLRKVLFP
ncbi:hypothetical protein Y032_0163g3510 [Ancylostoma ceylanicum]|uniref:Uncharacterized protein n=1 Tax=Ancylostoma ceylanicum TaxID=53326 RepID=A0A016SXT4_9BILA|nr:hypothetical protein Y032_0163g3510 [Ancylostoma ceylanicum]